MKNYFGISRDHSASMRPMSFAAAKDYNQTIDVISRAALDHKQDTVVSVVKCGSGHLPIVERETVNSSVARLKPLVKTRYQPLYEAEATGTPLFDSVGELIQIMEDVPDADDPDVSFLIMAITDGEENCSRLWPASKLMRKIQQLQATDRWTFVFRVPAHRMHRYKRELVNLGIPEGNVLEWEITEKGMETSTVQTEEAFRTFYTDRAAGQRSTKSFYLNLAQVSATEVKASMDPMVPGTFTAYTVAASYNGYAIKDFVELMTGNAYTKGTAFYELTKTEKEVQDYKVIIVTDVTTGKCYTGTAARQVLGLPTYGTVRLVPKSHGGFTIFIQSTSLNRKLVGGSTVIVWPDAPQK